MVETRPEASPIAKEAGKPGDNSRDDGASYRSPELGSGAARHPTEHLAGLGQEAMRTTAAEASMAAGSAVRSGSVVAESVQGSPRHGRVTPKKWFGTPPRPAARC